MPTFLVAGSIAYDLLLSYDGSFADGIDTDHLDELSVGYVTRHLERHHGGTAANIAWNFALLNQSVMVTGSVGNDGDDYLKRLSDKGIDISLVQKRDNQVTPTAIIGTDSNERQITFFHPGADRETEAPDVSKIKKDLSYALVSPHSVTAMQQTMHACKEQGIPYIFDPGQQTLQFSRDDLIRIVREASAIIANAYEWSILRNALGWLPEDAIDYDGLIIVTHGEHGLSIQTGEESIVIDAVPAENLVNPTGAGDALRAGLVTGLGHGWDIRDSARLGAAVASFAVESPSPQMGEFNIEKMYERAEEAYGKALPTL